MFRQVLTRAATRHPLYFAFPIAAIVQSVRLGHLTGIALATVIIHPAFAMLRVLRDDHGEQLPSFVEATRDFIRTDRLPPQLYWGSIGFPLASFALTLNHWFPPPFTPDARLLVAFSDAVFLPLAGLSAFALFLKMRAAAALEPRWKSRCGLVSARRAWWLELRGSAGSRRRRRRMRSRAPRD